MASARKALTQSCCYRNAGPCAISELPLTSCPAGADPSTGAYMVCIAPAGNVQPCSLPHKFTVLAIPGTWACSFPSSRHQHTGRLAKPRWDKLLWLLLTVCAGCFLAKRNQNSWKGSVPRQLHSYAQQSRENGIKLSIRSLQVQPAAYQLICSCKISRSFSTTFSLKIVISITSKTDPAYHNNLLWII